MPKQTARGNIFEIEVKKTLESQGWTVFRQHRKPIYMKGRMLLIGADIFGSDMVAKKAGEKPRWIQVSTQAQKAKKERQMFEFPWNLAHETAEIWLRTDGKKEYRVYHLTVTPHGKYSTDGSVSFEFVEQSEPVKVSKL